MSQDVTDDELVLVHVMDSSHQATSHYLSLNNNGKQNTQLIFVEQLSEIYIFNKFLFQLH